MPQSVHLPRSRPRLVELVGELAERGSRIKAVGGGHSWSDVACTDGALVSLDRLDRVLSIAPREPSIVVEAGMRLMQLNRVLHGFGLGMSVLGSISEQSIAGAISTGTHGSGIRFGNLATAVQALELVTAAGEVLELSAKQQPELFAAARVGLGALGIVSVVRLSCEPAFNLYEEAYPLGFDEALERLDELVDGHEHVKLWWLPHTDRVQVFTANRSSEPCTLPTAKRRFEASAASRLLIDFFLRVGRSRPAAIPRINRLLGASLFGPVRRVSPSVDVFNVPQVPVHRETEYAVGREHAVAALRSLRELIDERGLHVNFIVEARFVKADDIFLSPAYGRDTCQLGAYMFESRGIDEYFQGFEQRLLELGGRPHWGKEFSAGAEQLALLYPEYERFVKIRDRLDPKRTFDNAFTRRVLP